MRLNISFLIFSLVVLFISLLQADKPIDTLSGNEGMIKVTILYPNDEGKTFNMEYYKDKHMPMLQELMGESLKHIEIDKGIGGAMPNDAIPYLAIGYLYFDQLSDYQSSFGPNAEKIIGDIPNYTNIQPIVQISQVVQ